MRQSAERDENPSDKVFFVASKSFLKLCAIVLWYDVAILETNLCHKFRISYSSPAAGLVNPSFRKDKCIVPHVELFPYPSCSLSFLLSVWNPSFFVFLGCFPLGGEVGGRGGGFSWPLGKGSSSAVSYKSYQRFFSNNLQNRLLARRYIAFFSSPSAVWLPISRFWIICHEKSRSLLEMLFFRQLLQTNLI